MLTGVLDLCSPGYVNENMASCFASQQLKRDVVKCNDTTMHAMMQGEVCL